MRLMFNSICMLWCDSWYTHPLTTTPPSTVLHYACALPHISFKSTVLCFDSCNRPGFPTLCCDLFYTFSNGVRSNENQSLVLCPSPQALIASLPPPLLGSSLGQALKAVCAAAAPACKQEADAGEPGSWMTPWCTLCGVHCAVYTMRCTLSALMSHQ